MNLRSDLYNGCINFFQPNRRKGDPFGFGFSFAPIAAFILVNKSFPISPGTEAVSCDSSSNVVCSDLFIFLDLSKYFERGFDFHIKNQQNEIEQTIYGLLILMKRKVSP